MNALEQEIERIEAAWKRLMQGDFSVLTEGPVLLRNLRRQAAAATQSQEALWALYEISREIASVVDLDLLLELILDRALALAGGERGFLVLYDESADDFYVAVSHRFVAGTASEAPVELSHSLIRRVLDTRQPILTTNIQEAPQFQASGSITAYRIRSVLAAPLIFQDALIGAIYVDTRLAARPFAEQDLVLLTALANQAAVAIHIARLYYDLQTSHRALQKTLRELKEMQWELIQAERLSAVGRMAASIVHDLKGPMTVVRGYAAFLAAEGLSTAERETYVKSITRAVERLAGMTGDILDYARGEELQLDLQPVSIAAFVTDLCDFLRPEFAARGIELTTDLGYGGEVTMDADRLRRAFLNIAFNARDVMLAGGRFTISSRAEGDHVLFHLTDTGPGIPPEIRDRLFQPFVTHGKHHGTGLGLTIVQHIVESHGGTVGVASQPGQGATFVIRLPKQALRQVDKW